MRKVVVAIILIVTFVCGIGVGIITDRFLYNKPISQTGYPTYYTVNSSVKGFDGFTGEQIDNVLKGTAFYGLGQYYSFYAWQNDMSSLYLAAHAILEASEPGTNRTQLSYIARTKNNLFGFGAFDESPYYSADSFKSLQDCIQFCSAYIAKEYLDSYGLWYSGTSLHAINIHYASSTSWDDNIAAIMNELRYKIGNPDFNEAVAENWYIQMNGFNQLTLTKGQVIRDLARIYGVVGYKSAGEWAVQNKIVEDTPLWWNDPITRDALINIFHLAYKWKYPLSSYNFGITWGTQVETYKQWYYQALYKYYSFIQERRI
jgi:hypothetical protein